MNNATFAAALLDPAAPRVPPGLVTWNGSDAAQRFGVYRNNVTVSLIEALADTFPSCSNWSAKTFHAMVGEFVRRSPPVSPVLAWYGDTFADFVAAFSASRRCALPRRRGAAGVRPRAGLPRRRC